MKKQLLFAMALVAGIFTVNAQKTWNFTNFEKTSYQTTTNVDGLTIYAEAGKAVDIDGSNKTFEDYSFTQRLKFGGTGAFTEEGQPINRVLGFPVNGNAEITIIGTHASSSGDPRILNICAGSKDNVVGTMEVTPGAVDKKVINYTGAATNIYIYSTSSGINLYLLGVTESGPSGISSTAVAKEVVSTEYFNVVGVQQKELSKGLNIVKKTMDDGSVVVEKAYIK